MLEAAEFKTNDPRRSFVYAEYPLGGDYFIDRNEETYLLHFIWANIWATHALSACQKIARFGFRISLVRPPRIELGLRVPETL